MAGSKERRSTGAEMSENRGGDGSQPCCKQVKWRIREVRLMERLQLMREGATMRWRWCQGREAGVDVEGDKEQRRKKGCCLRGGCKKGMRLGETEVAGR
ncbi:hypothetical protein AMTR_s00075p00117210 [Amborella trichopoda]|uniref:Uncharacterized protein n=1 Tax=Amborella trichopoda TaxID=13333 RepID=W1P9J2_AMBTC|nr:hypothetical protein AMTR_s00075p00117210 [Amborella trichopoda]